MGLLDKSKCSHNNIQGSTVLKDELRNSVDDDTSLDFLKILEKVNAHNYFG